MQKLALFPPENQVLESLVSPLASSENRIPAFQRLQLGPHSVSIPKILLLGKRGGGDAIRLAVFSGIEAGSYSTVATAVHLLNVLDHDPSLAQDYALFFYPVANPLGFLPTPFPSLETRWQNAPRSRDAVFLRQELERQAFHGILRLRTSPDAFFHATTRSALIAQEVFEPALQTLGPHLSPTPVTVLSPSLGARKLAYARGALAPKPTRRSGPFEFDLLIPDPLPGGIRTESVTALIPEILSRYRRFISYGGEL
jgi:hypothetical protein